MRIATGKFYQCRVQVSWRSRLLAKLSEDLRAAYSYREGKRYVFQLLLGFRTCSRPVYTIQTPSTDYCDKADSGFWCLPSTAKLPIWKHLPPQTDHFYHQYTIEMRILVGQIYIFDIFLCYINVAAHILGGHDYFIGLYPAALAVTAFYPEDRLRPYPLSRQQQGNC